jgi:3',5'-cyclic AMP phosphodiesterase CpdA
MQATKIRTAGFGYLLVVVLSVSCAQAPPRAASEETKTDGARFHFAQLADIHFGRAENTPRITTAVETINALPMKIEFVAVTGDVTHESLENDSVVSECLDVLNGLTPPVHFLPGNHDILRKARDVTVEAYKKHFGDLISQQEYHGVVSIFMYTEPLAHSFTVPGYEPLKELERRLKEAAGKPVIIFHHTPSVESFHVNRMHPGWPKELREKWVALLNTYRVTAVIAGHFHRDEFHWLGDVPLYICSPVAGQWGRQATFRIYEYTDGKISYRTQYLR